MEKQAIVIEGNIFDGHNFHGPFSCIEDAIEWADRNIKADWLVATLHAIESDES